MDTIEQAPAGVEDITPSEDTATDNAQPVETGEATGAETEETGEAETLLAGKYKTVEELEKAYGEIQKTTGQLSQKAELANMLERTTGMNAQQIADYIKEQEQAQLNQAMQDNPGGYAIQKVQQLEAQLALKEEQAKLNDFISKNPGYEPFKDKILNLGLNLERNKDYSDIASEYFGQAIAHGQQSAYKKIEQKQMTQATGQSKVSPREKLTLEDMDNMSAQELEAILPHADVSNRLY